MGENVLRRHTLDLEGVHCGSQTVGPFDDGCDVCRVGVYSLPKTFDPFELWPEHFKFLQQAGQFL